MSNRRILPPRYFIMSILLIPLLHFIIPASQLIGFPWNLSGLPFLAAGGIFNLLADNDFKKYNTTVKPFEISTALITEGVFKISRNPMYLGMLLFLLGESILFGSATVFIVPVGFGFLLHFAFILREEKMLIKTFGENYQNYMGSVRRWI